MVMVNAANDALVAAIKEFIEKSGSSTHCAIALMRSTETLLFDISLVEVRNGSCISEEERLKGVAEKKVAAVARELFSKHVGFEVPDKEIPVFFEVSHERPYRRCWYLVHVASRYSRKVRGKEVVSPYNPTIT